jgi:hypothetical protein
MMRADVVNAVLEKGCEAIVLSDSSKFSVVHPYPLGPVARFSRIITDSSLHDDARQQLTESGLTVDIVSFPEFIPTLFFARRFSSPPPTRVGADRMNLSESFPSPQLRVFTCR